MQKNNSKNDRMIEIIKMAGVDLDTSNMPTTGQWDVWQQLDKTEAEYDKHGNVKKLPRAINNRYNLACIFEGDHKYDTLCYNDHSDQIFLDDQEINGAMIEDIGLNLELDYRLKAKNEEIRGGLLRVAMQRVIEPIRTYLDNLAWDGVNRLGHMLAENFSVEVPQGAEDLIGTFGVRWAVGCVARIYDPGCEMHTVLTLVGRKGLGKGRALKALASPQWFSNSNIDISSKSAYELIHQSGVWLWELAELHALNGKTADNAKMFLSASSDRYRPTWGKTPVNRGRRTVFVASSNNYQFLTDGPERRFWPIHITNKINVEWIEQNRDQLWAEAVHWYREGVQWWLTDHEQIQLDELQQTYIIDDPWAMRVLQHLRLGTDNTTAGIMKMLEIPPAQQHTGNARRIATICRDIGWAQVREGNDRKWVCVK